MISTNPDTEDRLHEKTQSGNPNPNADRPDHTASTNPDTEDRLHDKPTHDKIINSAFTSFEEVRAKHQTAQRNYVKNQLRRGFFKC